MPNPVPLFARRSDRPDQLPPEAASALQRSAGLILFLTLACTPGRTPPAPEVVNVRMAGAEAPLAYGDCAEAERRLAADPEMPVDRVPTPLAMKPAPFQKVPAGAWKKDGSAVIKVEVMVDTTGRADMKTFKPVTVSHPWFAQNLRTVMPRWRFSPATVAGCKVRRVYRFSATVPPRAQRAKTAARRTSSQQAAGRP
jgi:hypothetical protein